MRRKILVEKSPNWDKAINAYERLLPGTMMPGFPFMEGYPTDLHKSCFIVTRDLRLQIARVDFSDQYRAEGLAWRDRDGYRIESHIVAGWMQIIGPTS